MQPPSRRAPILWESRVCYLRGRENRWRLLLHHQHQPEILYLMKKLLIPALLLAAASSYGVTSDLLKTATDARLNDYTNWFTPQFNVSSDADYYSTPFPPGVPAGFSDANRTWSGWTANWSPTALGGPIVGKDSDYDPQGKLRTYTTKVEFAFLGETAGWWDNIGYRLTDGAGNLIEEKLLADGIQTVAPNTNREFGDYWEYVLDAGNKLDFFVIGTEKSGPNEIIDPTPVKGGKFFVFDETANIPGSAMEQSYYGQLQPLTNERVVDKSKELYKQSWTVMGFEDIQTKLNSHIDYNDIGFAFRADYFVNTAVPEPSTYGLIGAVALLGLAGYRRYRKS